MDHNYKPGTDFPMRKRNQAPELVIANKNEIFKNKRKKKKIEPRN
jgi:hypothetical protein